MKNISFRIHLFGQSPKSFQTSASIKCLFFLSIILFLALNSFGQKRVSPNSRITSKFAQYQNVLGNEPYSFVIDGERYILSYDTLKYNADFDSKGEYIHPEYLQEIANRPAFIFRFNGTKWVKATSEPVQYDSNIRGRGSNSPTISDYYFDAFTGNRANMTIAGGMVAMLITNVHSNNMENPTEYKYIKMVVLQPLGNKMYRPMVYNALNAGKNPYDYASMLAQMNNVDINKSSFELTTNGETIKFERAIAPSNQQTVTSPSSNVKAEKVSIKYEQLFDLPTKEYGYTNSNWINISSRNNGFLITSLEPSQSGNGIIAIYKFDRNGNSLWQTKINYSGNIYSIKTVEDSFNNIFVIGYSDLMNIKGSDKSHSNVFFMKIDRTGTPTWVHHLPSPHDVSNIRRYDSGLTYDVNLINSGKILVINGVYTSTLNSDDFSKSIGKKYCSGLFRANIDCNSGNILQLINDGTSENEYLFESIYSYVKDDTYLFSFNSIPVNEGSSKNNGNPVFFNLRNLSNIEAGTSFASMITRINLKNDGTQILNNGTSLVESVKRKLGQMGGTEGFTVNRIKSINIEGLTPSSTGSFALIDALTVIDKGSSTSNPRFYFLASFDNEGKMLWLSPIKLRNDKSPRICGNIIFTANELIVYNNDGNEIGKNAPEFVITKILIDSSSNKYYVLSQEGTMFEIVIK